MGRSVQLPPGNSSHPDWAALTLAFTGHNTGETVAGRVTNIKNPGTNDGTISGSVTRNDTLGLVDANAAGKVTFPQIDCGTTGSGFTVMFRAKLAALNTASMVFGRGATTGYFWLRKSSGTVEYSPGASSTAGSSINWAVTDANFTSQRDYCLVVEAASGGLSATRLYQKAVNETSWTLVGTTSSTAAGARSITNIGEAYTVGSAFGFAGEIEYFYIFADTPLSASQLNANFADPYDIVSTTSVTLTPQSAANNRVKIKKSSGTYNITLAGSYTGQVTGIEYRLGPSGAWQTLVSSVSGGTFSQAIAIPGTAAFQGITIRATNDTAKTSTDPDFTIADEIWLLAVDSLAAGRLLAPQTHTGGTYRSYCYTSGAGWLLASDGVGLPNVDVGSHWPLLANLLREDRIVCFIQTAASGQKLTGKRASGTTTLVNNSGCGGITGILAHGGANDIAQSETTTDSAAAWSTELQAYADSYATAYPGCKTYVHVCPDVTQLTSVDARANNIRRGVFLAATANANVLVGANIWWLQFATDGLHPKSNAEAQAVAEAWWAAVRTNAASTPAPKIVDAKHNAAKTVVSLRFDRSLRSGTLSPNCFRVTDNGTPVTVSSAVAAGSFVTLTLASAAAGTLVANMGWGEGPFGTPPQSGVAVTNLYGDYYRPAEPFYDQAVTPSDTTAPTLASATINSAGTICTLSFLEVDSQPILPIGGVTGFSLTASGGAVSIASASRTDYTTLVLALSRVIVSGETLTISYSGGNLTDSAETPNSLATITNAAVTNNSTAPASPVFTTGTASVVGQENGFVLLICTRATGGTAPISYQWHRSTVDGFTPGPGNALFGGPLSNPEGLFGDGGLTNGTTYYYRCVATDATSATVTSTQVSATPVNRYPAVGDVQSGVTFGPSGTLTGTLALPTVGQVQSGVGYGAGGTEFTGTIVLPVVGDVQSGVTFGPGSGSTGTLVLPTVGQVQSGVGYGAGGTEFTGTLSGGGGGSYTSAANVRFGTDRGDGVTGTLRVPSAAQVLSGVLVDATTGTVVLPAVGDVQTGVTFGPGSGSTGTLVLPAASQVLYGVGYGAGGTEFTGTATSGGGTLDDEQVALAVYRRLAGGAVGLLEGPTAGDPLDAIHSADFQYTFDAAVAADSTLIFSIRRDVADAAPVIELTGGAITSLFGQSPVHPLDGSLVRLSATQCRARIKARSLVLIPPGQYCAEFRELSAAGDTLSRHEIGITFRRGASRRQA